LREPKIKVPFRHQVSQRLPTAGIGHAPPLSLDFGLDVFVCHSLPFANRWRFGECKCGFDDRCVAWLYRIQLGGDLCLARGDRSMTPAPANAGVISRVATVTQFRSGAAFVRECLHSGSERRFNLVDRH
jgi:hypothetical protein